MNADFAISATSRLPLERRRGDMALPQGPCHVCGKQKVLTYEHVPASSSYNNEPVEMFGFEHWLKRAPSGEMNGGELKDRGAGVHTLCADCNSLTGGQYVPELREWTGRGMSIVLQATKEGQPAGNAVECVLKKVRPALFLKQVITMLASVNQPALLDHHPDLRRYVLDRDATGLPARYQFYLTLTHPKSTVFRFAGLTPLLRDGIWCVTWLTDLVWRPFGYVMTIDEPRPLFPIGNISAFADRRHKEVDDVVLQLPLLIAEQPYSGELSDPTQTADQPSRFPTQASARVGFHIEFASGECRDGEISHPVAISEWRGPDLREVIQSLLRVLCIDKNDSYQFLVRWDRVDVLVEVRSEKGLVRLAQLPIAHSTVREFIGHDDALPEEGECRHADVLLEQR